MDSGEPSSFNGDNGDNKDHHETVNSEIEDGSLSAAGAGAGVASEAPKQVISSYSFFSYDNIPSAYRLNPTEEELLYCLRRKLRNQSLPLFCPIIDVPGFYEESPDTIVERHHLGKYNQLLFFGREESNYKHGERRNRAIGYWNEADVSEFIHAANGVVIGYKRFLAHYVGKAPSGWLMHEYRLACSHCKGKRETHDDIKLDDWVVGRLYRSKYKGHGLKLACSSDGR